jgi:hypothetical protein
VEFDKITPDMHLIQKEFFKTLKSIQEEIVYSSLSSYKNEVANDDFLFSVTYDTIYKIMELIDGYYAPNLKLDLIDNNSGKSLKADIELHDSCASYLKSG